MASPTAPQQSLPHRSTTMSTDEDAVPGEDTSEVTRLFSSRLTAWKTAVAYLEDYVESTEKLHHGLGKDYEKVLKTVSHPLKEGDHFDQSLGGIAGMFDNIRSNTQGIANTHHETAKTLKGSVLPMFSRLLSELKHKNKELAKGAGKGSKVVDKARNTTQKHIELLGQHTATFDSSGGKVDATNDPYVLQRGVWHRLNKQVIEENNNRQDLIAVQNSFAQFEANVIKQIQAGLGAFFQVVSAQEDHTKQMYGDLVANAQRVPADFEWNGFIRRNNEVLIDPSQPPRSISNLSFPNQDHRSTQPLIAGSLDKKGKLLKKYDTFYYVITPSKFLHEYKTDDDFAKEPVPENSLYLPDCTIGALDGEKFAVKGKDLSKGKFGNNFSMSHEYTLKAHTAADALQWYDVIKSVAGATTSEKPAGSTPVSPVDAKHTAPLQTTGIIAAEHEKHQHTPTSATAAHSNTAPTSATTAYPQSATTAAAAAPASALEYQTASSMHEPQHTVAGNAAPAASSYAPAAHTGTEAAPYSTTSPSYTTGETAAPYTASAPQHTGTGLAAAAEERGTLPQGSSTAAGGAYSSPTGATGPTAEAAHSGVHTADTPTGAAGLGATSEGTKAVEANPNLSSVGPVGSK